VDTPETLAARLLAAAAAAPAAVQAVVAKGALNVKTESKRNVLASAPVQNAHAHNAITYDTTVRAAVISAEIGYDKDRNGGALGNLLEFGGGRDFSPPHRDLGRALDAEEPRFEAEMDAVAGRLLS
jgi:hypothetical protein